MTTTNSSMYEAQIRLLLSTGWVEVEPLAWRHEDGRRLAFEDNAWFYDTISGTARLGADFAKAVGKIVGDTSWEKR